MDFKIKERYTIDELLTIVNMLRDKDNGCPWDKVQTHQTIRKNFIEETYEVIEAIDENDKSLMQEELGDVLLQILLHAQFEKEANVFDFSDVVNGVAQKLVLRHPHIFAGYENKTVDGVLEKWEEIKKVEKGQNTASEAIHAIPKSFPALMYTQKLQKRATAGKLFRRSKLEIVEMLQENLDKIKEKIKKEDTDQQLDKPIGELLYNLVSLASLVKCDAEEVLGQENRKKVMFFTQLDKLLLQSDMEFDTINNELLNRTQE